MAPVRAATAKTHILNDCDLRTLLEPTIPGSKNFLATKVTITIGPACQDVETLVELLLTGVTCARLDLTWGKLEFHKRSLDNLQEAQRRTRKLCAVMLDTTGRELVLKRAIHHDENGWPIHESGVAIAAGQKVTFTTSSTPSTDPSMLPISYEKFPSMCEKGDTIFMGRYLVTGAEESSVYLEVLEVTDNEVVCVANNGCSLEGLVTVFHTERSDHALSNLQNDLPILSENDKKIMSALCQQYEIDFISLSFTRTKEDVQRVREFCDELGMTSTKLIAKIETRQSLFNFQAIAAAADGVIISRGNLGLDVLPEKMALTQKRMISICNIHGKPVYITRVVDTMIGTPRPTRAEATDIANACLDGVDGILLGAETLRGKYPVDTVRTVFDICSQAEDMFDHNHHYEYLTTVKDVKLTVDGKADNEEDEWDPTWSLAFKRTTSQASLNSSDGPGSYSALSSAWNLSQMASIRDPNTLRQLSKRESIASSAVRAAFKVGASMIIVYSKTGRTASLLAKYRPPVPILTLVVPTLQSDGLKWHLQGKYVARQCLIQHSLLPVLAAPSPSGETLLEEAVYMSVCNGLLQPQDHIVVIQEIYDDLVLKIVSVDDYGQGIKTIRPKSLENLISGTLPEAPEPDDDMATTKTCNVLSGHANLVHGEDFSDLTYTPALTRTNTNASGHSRKQVAFARTISHAEGS